MSGPVLAYTNQTVDVSGPYFSFRIINVRTDWPWISSVLNCHLIEDTTGLIAFDRRGEPAGVVVLDSWTDSACCCHIAVANPLILRHGFLELAADMIFVKRGRIVLIGLVPSNNLKAIRFDLKIGFHELYRVRDGYQVGVDTVVMEMRRETCRWLKPRGVGNGQEIVT